MGAASMNTFCEPRARDTSDWPDKVKFMLSVLEERPALVGEERRTTLRAPYHKRATLQFLDGHGNPSQAVTIFTRDVNTSSLGLLSSTQLPVGTRAILHLPSPGDRTWHIACSIVRCHRFIDDWYEGALYFDQEQAALRPRHEA
jgi:hypothetical protein